MQGKKINGFELKRQLGVGGMAEVWYAENKIGKKAAVKILLSKLCADDNVVSRFFTEAKVMVELNHPNIRQVYDYGDIDGRPTIIMEYLEGSDLKSMLKQGSRFSDDQLIKWWNQMVGALNYTHSKGIIHRDIKPGNLFVDNHDNIKLLDFGIAKVRESICSTQTGQKLGTLMYMSPEQVKDSKSIDYRTDVYSLAVTFVHLITGHKPYDSDTSSDFEISEQIVYKPLDLKGLSPFWSDILTPYLRKDVYQRPPLQTINDASKVKNNNTNYDEETIYTIESDNHKNPASYSEAEKATVTKKEQQNTINAKQKRNKTWIWILIILVLGSGITLKTIYDVTKRKEIIERFTEKYVKKTEICDIFINNIVKDKDGNEGSKHFIMQALTTLQEIEEMEQLPVFNKTGIPPASQQMFSSFIVNLKKAKSLVNKEYQDYVNMGMTDNKRCKELKQRLNLMQDILKQSEQGSASAIQMAPAK